jgi:hydroxymethylpyrimidine/phosphomethylpyrimidine kinase
MSPRLLPLTSVLDSDSSWTRCRAEGESTLSLEHVPERGAGPGPIVYFECQRLDETVRRLTAGGIQFDTASTDQPWLWREARLRDPAGNSLCLHSAGPNRRYPPWQVG